LLCTEVKQGTKYICEVLVLQLKIQHALPSLSPSTLGVPSMCYSIDSPGINSSNWSLHVLCALSNDV